MVPVKVSMNRKFFTQRMYNNLASLHTFVGCIHDEHGGNKEAEKGRVQRGKTNRSHKMLKHPDGRWRIGLSLGSLLRKESQ